MKKRIPSFLRHVGPGVVTGAADDDPSGIATYTQAGAQFGTGLLWTVFLSLPFMVAIQLVSARIGRVTGKGVAANLREHMPRGFLIVLVALLVVANTINIAADIAAMGEALQLVVGGGAHFHALVFGVVTVLLQVFVPYRKLAHILKWLTLTLFAYVAAVFVVRVEWAHVLHDLVVPRLQWSGDYWMMIVALLGTTISPYLFFWQASQEVEDNARRPEAAKLRDNAEYAAEHLSRIKQDTSFGMVFSNVIALCIVIATAVTLNMHGVTNIQTSSQAAEALRPVAGEFAFAIFAIGIIGTGLLAVPVLAGSAAYAVSEAFGWKAGLSRGFHEARGFYVIIIAATVIGTLMSTVEVDPIKALVWSAIVNGVISVPIMVVMMWIGQSKRLMGSLTISPRHRFFGWAATAVMGAAVAGLFVTSFLAT
jgi:NRAMP (natural resistance-associated macrophage protein)-like metal ion transporter